MKIIVSMMPKTVEMLKLTRMDYLTKEVTEVINQFMPNIKLFVTQNVSFKDLDCLSSFKHLQAFIYNQNYPIHIPGTVKLVGICNHYIHNDGNLEIITFNQELINTYSKRFSKRLSSEFRGCIFFNDIRQWSSSCISKKILKKRPIKKRPIRKPPTKKPPPKTTKKYTARRPITTTTKYKTRRPTTTFKRYTTRRPITTTKKSTTIRPTTKKTATKKPTTTTKKTTTPKPDKYAKLKSEILEDINKLREKYRSPPLKVNTTIAKDTQTYATEFAKTGGGDGEYNGPLGQVFYFASPEEEIKPLGWWTRDSDRIDFENIDDGFVDPEFSQLIWKSTKQIGCGAYKNEHGIFIFCRFYPKGNVPGQYKENILKPLDDQ
uniref:SCP domain-containing protein n=1 Tax=Strongyloides papillosus TaxID=174720 RepID=A0A0N5BSY6_STREA